MFRHRFVKICGFLLSLEFVGNHFAFFQGLSILASQDVENWKQKAQSCNYVEFDLTEDEHQ
jgi:hypothetical protein